MFCTTKNQLERAIGGDASHILSVADLNKPRKGEWEIYKVKDDPQIKNLYYAEFDLPQAPGSILRFKIQTFPGSFRQSEYDIIEKIDNS